jgi:hypothetical protein
MIVIDEDHPVLSITCEGNWLAKETTQYTNQGFFWLFEVIKFIGLTRFLIKELESKERL